MLAGNFRRAQHHRHVPGSRGDRRRVGALPRTRAAADQRRHAVRETGLDLLRGNEINVRIDAGGSQVLHAREGVGRRPTSSPGVIRSIVWGLPDFPIALMRPSLIPTSAFITPASRR